jgi:hypothetical protein
MKRTGKTRSKPPQPLPVPPPPEQPTVLSAREYAAAYGIWSDGHPRRRSRPPFSIM